MHTRLPFSRVCLSVAIALAATAPAQARDTEVIEMNSLTVLGDLYRNTATKTALAPEDTPQSISILDREVLAMRDADTVGEALRYTAGVSTELRGGAITRFDLFNIRGFENSQNYYDGLRLLYNDWNLQPQIDLAAVEQVEVFKGPTSTLYGGMAPGGMVNMISKGPSTDAFNRVAIASGSHNLIEGNLESRGQIGETDLSYSVVGLARQKDGQAATTEEERYMVAPQLNWQASDNTLVNVNLYYQKDPEMGAYSTLPAAGLFRDNANGRLPTNAYAGDKNWEQYEREVLMVGYKINHIFNDNWSLLQNLRYTDATAYQENTYNTGLGGDQRTLGRRAYLTDEATEGVTVDHQLTGTFTTGPVEHNLLVGVDYLYMDSDIRYEDALAPAIDLFAPDHELIDRNVLAFNPAYSTDLTLTKEQLGFYLQDQLRLDQLVLIGGVRYDDYRGKNRGQGTADSETEQDNVSFRAGALYEFANGISPFVSYAESFEAVNGEDQYDNEFKPSTADQWEAGVKYATVDRRTTWTAAAFRIEKDNVPTRDPNGGPYDEIQAGQVRSQGVELEARVQPVDNLLLSAAYTWQDVEVTEDNSGLEGKTPVWVPEQLLSVWADYSFTEGALAGANAGAGIRYIGEAELDALNSDTVPDATLLDLALGYELGYLNNSLQGSSVALSVNNALDERYYSCYDAQNCWFGAERTVEVSLAHTF